ncbi:helix-turn-helix domain-containing protein [Oceanirhabdus seepicola]|uniref:Helix-turn-helix domain-containing protein n=1 Tax=Oceanirhabdus seepicola TaxID=2828781 RepID=A0A9J6P3R6_9CLOT|nr:helix-turn-helix domain-containing protein [Oceanirhabdus seepicola]MCM1991335.1 helix-turn-helix domain-containing protein [Oceanirhabdus seepicola]
MTITKNHISSQNKLSVNQLNAIDLLIQGKTDQETADIVGVARETVTRWRNENPYFAAEMNRQRKQIWEGQHERLRGLVSKAVDTLEKAIDEGNVKAAIELLKVVDFYGNVKAPSGEEDPELILWQQARVWAEIEVAKKGPSNVLLDNYEFKQQDIVELTHKRMKKLRKIL